MAPPSSHPFHVVAGRAVGLVLFLGVGLWLSTAGLLAQGAIDGGAIVVKVRGSYVSGLSNPSLTISLPTQDPEQEVISLVATPATSGATPEKAFVLPVGTKSTFQVDAANVETFGLTFAAPGGYQVLIGDAGNDPIQREGYLGKGVRNGGDVPIGGTKTDYLDVLIVRLPRAYQEPESAAAGALGDAGRLSWGAPPSAFGPPSIPRIEFNLGQALNGEPLPPLVVYLSDSSYWGPSSCVERYTHPDTDFTEPSPGTFWISAPQVDVEFAPSTNSSQPHDFRLSFYLPGQTSNPFVVYDGVFTYQVVGVAHYFKTVKIKKTVGESTYEASLESAANDAASFWNTAAIYGSWTLKDWHLTTGTTATPRKVDVTRNVTHPSTFVYNYWDVITVTNPSGTVDLSRRIDFRQTDNPTPPDLHELVFAAGTITDGYGSAAPRVSEVWLDAKNRPVGSRQPSGRAMAAEFAGTGSALRPVKTYRSGLAGSPTYQATTGAVSATVADFAEYLYANDHNGVPVLPISMRQLGRKPDNSATKLLAESTLTYANATANGQPILIATRYDFVAEGTPAMAGAPRSTNDGASLQTIVKKYRQDTTNRILVSRPYSIERPDGTKVSFAYETGDLGSGSSPTFAVPGTTGSDVRITTLSGVKAGEGGQTVTSLPSGTGSVSVDEIGLIAKKSTKTVEILRRGFPIRREVYVVSETSGSAPVFELLGWETFTYTSAGQLETRQGSDHTSYTATWLNGRLSTTQDETGLVATLGYDEMDRITSIESIPAGALVASQLTTIDYDAESRVAKVKQGPLGAQVVSQRIYDAAGRLDEVKSTDGVRTKYSYPNSERDVSIIYNYGTTESATREITRYPDGRVLEVKGSATVEEHYLYGFDNFNRPSVTVKYGASQKRPRTVVFDLLGRVAEEWSNGFASEAAAKRIVTFREYNAHGLTSKVYSIESGSGLHLTGDRLMEYDAMGTLIAAGLDLDGTPGLQKGGTDRYEDYDASFYKDGDGVWWREVTRKLYHTDNVTTPHTATTRTRLSQFPAGTIAQSVSSDYYGNTTTETVDFSNVASERWHRLRAVQPDGTTLVRTIVRGFVADEKWFDDAHADLSGLPVLQTSYAYDTQGRLTDVTDARTGTSHTAYDGNTLRPLNVFDGHSSTIPVASYSYDGAGRVATRATPVGIASYKYNGRGQVEEESGNGTLPIRREYSEFGELTRLKTYRQGLTGTADVTTWDYDDQTGWLYAKTDAADKIVSYDYAFVSGFREVTRAWARPEGPNSTTPITTTYRSSLSTGDLLEVLYSDSTPDLTYHYTRSGLVKDVSESDPETGTTRSRSFAYDHEQLSRETLDPNWYGGLALTTTHDTAATSAASNHLLGRYTGFTLGTSAELDREMAVDYRYDDFGRVDGVTATYKEKSAPQRPRISIPATYHYKDSSAMWDSLTQGSFTVERDFETNRDVLRSLTSAHTTGGTIARFGYHTDDAGRRDWATQVGMAFGDVTPATYYRYTHNERDELTTATGYRGTLVTDETNPILGRKFAYDYDTFGNRKSVGVGTETAHYQDADGGDGGNKLNQTRRRQTLSPRVSGSAHKDAAVTVGGAPAQRWDRYFDVPVSNPAAGQNTAVTVSATLNGLSATKDVRVIARPSPETLRYDDDGNLSEDGQWLYDWDAENRLKHMKRSPAAVSWGAPDKELWFTYDYMGRRIRKKVEEAGVVTYDRKFVYEGWNLVAEIDTASGKIVRSYVWGLDVASTLDATGGVGALALETVHTDTELKSYHVAHDGSGNVTALVRCAPGDSTNDGKVAAAYEYGPFGELVRAETLEAPPPGQTQSPLANQPFRYSTKFTDVETGLVYYGYRFYDPSLGRFISRDPIAETGGANLYGFVGNGPVNSWDVLGLWYDVYGRWHSEDGTDDPFEIPGLGSIYDIDISIFVVGAASSAGDVADRERQSKKAQSIGVVDAAKISAATAARADPLVSRVLAAVGIYRETGSIFVALNGGFNGVYDVISHADEASEGRSLQPESMGEKLSTTMRVVSGVTAVADATAVFGAAGAIAREVAPVLSTTRAVVAETEAALGNASRVPGSCFLAGTLIATGAGARPIEDLRVGDRVLTNDENAASTEIDPDSWRRVTLRMPNPDYPADTLDLVLLRSEAWMHEVGCEAGAHIWFDLDEMGLHGWSNVIAIDPCPQIQPAAGRVVLATVTHYNSYLMELRFIGHSETLQLTDRHRLFSVTRGDWIPSGELNVGEQLASQQGVVQIEAIRNVPSTHRVYNIEVETEHCFYAGDAGILSHNTIPCAKPLLPAEGKPPVKLLQSDLEHIVERHWYGNSTPSGELPAGKFGPETTARSLRDMIADAARDGTSRPNTGGRPGTIREIDFGRTIGVDSHNNPTSRLRVVVRPDGTVVTAFPY